MTWTINWADDARKQLRKLDKQTQADVLNYLSKRVLKAEHPCDFGKPLRHDKYGLWRYRIKNIRVICQIRQEEMFILIVRLGHRKDVYR